MASDGSRFLVTGHYGELSNGTDIGDTHLESAGGHDAFLAWVDGDGGIEQVASISGDGWVVGRGVAWSPRRRWITGGLRTAELELSGATLDAVDGSHGGYLWAGPE